MSLVNSLRGAPAFTWLAFSWNIFSYSSHVLTSDQKYKYGIFRNSICCDLSHVFLMIILGMNGFCKEDYRGRKWHFHHSVSSKDVSFQYNMSLSILMWLGYCLSSFCSENLHFLPFPHRTIWKEAIQYSYSQESGIKLYSLQSRTPKYAAWNSSAWETYHIYPIASFTQSLYW